jgi:hypothetical protein
VDVPGFKSGYKDAPIGLAEEQPLTGQLGEGFADGVSRDAQILGDGGFGQLGAGHQEAFGQLIAQFLGNPLGNGRHPHADPGPRAIKASLLVLSLICTGHDSKNTRLPKTWIAGSLNNPAKWCMLDVTHITRQGSHHGNHRFEQRRRRVLRTLETRR